MRVAVLRNEVGGVLRDFRQQQGRTLRQVSNDARVSLGYLSEVERGQKEASSEMISAICNALNTPLSAVLREVTDRVTRAEKVTVPDTIPADFYHGLITRGSSAIKTTPKFANTTASLPRNKRTKELAGVR